MRKKMVVSFVVIASTLLIGKILIPAVNNNAFAQEQTVPAYAKWGRLAMEKVKENYPTADIIDYLHVGREVGEITTNEKFKLWLRGKDNKEFGVYVTITFHNKSEQITNIEYKETEK